MAVYNITSIAALEWATIVGGRLDQCDVTSLSPGRLRRAAGGEDTRSEVGDKTVAQLGKAPRGRSTEVAHSCSQLAPEEVAEGGWVEGRGKNS